MCVCFLLSVMSSVKVAGKVVYKQRCNPRRNYVHTNDVMILLTNDGNRQKVKPFFKYSMR